MYPFELICMHIKGCIRALVIVFAVIVVQVGVDDDVDVLGREAIAFQPFFEWRPIL